MAGQERNDRGPGLAPASSHLPEFDVMRGAAIVSVVYLHAYFSPWDVTPRRELVAMHVIHLFAHTAVPVFFFISAFLLARDTTPTFGLFVRNKLRRIYVPLLFWMAAAFVYRLWDEGGASTELWKSAALFNVSGQFYYLVVLTIFYGGFSFLRDWPAGRLWLLAAMAFVVNLATIAYYQSSSLHGDFATLAYRNPLAWVFFYSFGYAAGRARGLPFWEGWPRWPALAGMAGVLAVYVVQGERSDNYPVSYFGVSVFLFSCLTLVALPGSLVSLLRARPGRWMTAPFRWLSRYALPIYLVHMPFFIGYLTNRLVSDSSLNDDYFKLMNGLFVWGFTSSLAFVLVVERVAPRFAAEFMGLDPRRPGSR